MALGENISTMRKELRLSQEYVAEQLGVSRQAVSKWETGQSEPTAKNLVELAALFGISLSELVEPERVEQKRTSENKYTKERIASIMICAYTGAQVLSTLQTNIPNYIIFVLVMALLPAVAMAILIWLESPQIRFKRAVRELVYCIVVVLAARLLPLMIGNIITALILCVLLALYIKYIRFR